jgi:hypothetical protein
MTCDSRDDQDGYIAVEWWPDVYDAIRFAVARGVIVVEAAGNGSEDLDDPIYDTPAFGFPSGWRNPFRRREADSGAVLVGAGAPPSESFGPDRSRLDFSNFGAAVDAQGWGYGVATCGYGDLQAGDDEDRWYTASFSGTSSASPIVVGALASLQGNARAARRGHHAAARVPAVARDGLAATRRARSAGHAARRQSAGSACAAGAPAAVAEYGRARQRKQPGRPA